MACTAGGPFYAQTLYYQISVINYVPTEEHCLGLFLGVIKALVVNTECKTKTAKNHFQENKMIKRHHQRCIYLMILQK